MRLQVIVLALGWICGLGAASAQGTHRDKHMVTGHQVVLRPDAPSISPITSVRSVYVLNCAGCHGMDGHGAYSAKVPDLRQMGNFLRLPGGRNFLISVPGVLGSGLDDEQIASVLNWMLDGMASDTRPAGEPPYVKAEVTRARASPLADVMSERRRLVALANERGIPLDIAPVSRP